MIPAPAPVWNGRRSAAIEVREIIGRQTSAAFRPGAERGIDAKSLWRALELASVASRPGFGSDKALAAASALLDATLAAANLPPR